MLLKRAVAAQRIPEKKLERAHAEKIAMAEMRGKLIKRDYSRGHPAEVRIRLPADWHKAFLDGSIPVTCVAVLEGGGNPVPLDYIAQRKIALKPGRVDDMLLFVLEDIQSGDMTKPVVLTKADFVGIIDMLGIHGRPLYQSGGNPIRVEKTELESKLVVDMDRETGEILLMLTTDIPGAPEGSVPDYIVFGNKGFAYLDGVLWPLKSVLPGLYQKVYQETIAIPRKGTFSFIKNELSLLEKLMPLHREIDFDLFLMQPAIPHFSLRIRGNGASISMTLFANYDGAVSVSAAAPDPGADFSIPDETDFYLYYVRNLEVEKHAIKKLRDMRIVADSGTSISPLTGERIVLNFLGTQMPALERAGWSVQMDNDISSYYLGLNRTVPVVEIEQTKNANSFEIGYAFRVVNGKRNVNPTDIHRAIQMHESFVRLGKDIVLFDRIAIEDLRDALRDCNSEPGTRPGFVRISNVHAPYIKSSLDALDKTSIRVRSAPQEWKVYADKHNRLTKVSQVSLEEPLRSILRPYQKDGVAWLRFLESNRLGGILADEMGLGKTLQALTWLGLERFNPEHRGKPALVVCPTSLVDNWVHESLHFTPDLKIIAMSGAQRHENFENLEKYDLIIT
ncbi:MAG: DEAD/DEAH box helicase, partial [Lentisphaerae bacterium]|nr:DEAD/DEAH box helicase [Lentisphaerota bacterium]